MISIVYMIFFIMALQHIIKCLCRYLFHNISPATVVARFSKIILNSAVINLLVVYFSMFVEELPAQCFTQWILRLVFCAHMNNNIRFMISGIPNYLVILIDIKKLYCISHLHFVGSCTFFSFFLSPCSCQINIVWLELIRNIWYFWNWVVCYT